MIDKKHFAIHWREQLDGIEYRLQGHVFHITKLIYLESIEKSYAIHPNSDGKLPTTFGSSSGSFFRLYNCVPLFDYRPKPTEEIKHFRQRCSPFMRAHDGIAILFLKPIAYDDVITYDQAVGMGASGKMIVPHVEAGYRGSLSLSLIAEIWTLKNEIVKFPLDDAACKAEENDSS